MKQILMDGVIYDLWPPTKEEDLEAMVQEHANDVFGDQSIYFNIKKKLKSQSGIGSIPDGYVIILADTPYWHIVEVELSSHDLYQHIVSQVSKFIGGIQSPHAQRMIAAAIYEEIVKDDFLRLRLKRAIGSTEIHKFLSDLIAQTPVLTVIIEEDTEQLREALKALSHQQIRVVEFQTFARRDIGMGVHAHLFEPLFKRQIDSLPPIPVSEDAKVSARKAVEITLRNPSFRKFHLFTIPRAFRDFFPGYKIPFKLETNIGIVETHVTSAPIGTEEGDPQAGRYIQRNLANWYRKHPEIDVGSKVVIEAIEPGKRYRLSTVE